MELLSSLTFVK